MKIVIFGTGLFYENRKMQDCIQQNEVVAFLDNNNDKVGSVLDGKVIYNPQEINALEYDYIVVMSKAENEMRTQLKALGVSDEKVLNYGELTQKYLQGEKREEKNQDNSVFFACNHPEVSVIIPNYNYERYLEERIESIVSQTYRPTEIIFLDDCSTDNSVECAKEILSRYDIPYQVVSNKDNNGCFRQWLKGIAMSKGEYVWIAEADDLCEKNFLEMVLPKFDDVEVNISYAQSEVIYEDGEHSGYVYTEYTKTIDEVKWSHDYINNGVSEVLEALAIANTIPNASGVVLRKSALEGIDEMLSQFFMSGDWFTYVYAIRHGKIAFTSEVLNYHRRHRQSIIMRSERQIALFEELLKIKKFIAEEFIIPASIFEKFVTHVENEYRRLINPNCVENYDGNEILIQLQRELEETAITKLEKYSFAQNVPKKRIMFVAPDFSMGGGQTLIIRLANFMARYHDVYIYNARPWIEEDRIVSMISNKVRNLESNGTPEQLKEYIISLNIETINSHIWWSDKIVYKALKKIPGNRVNHLLCMHGCYEMLMEHPECDVEFDELVPEILGNANNIIYGSEKNRRIFSIVDVPEEKLHQVYYGYEIQSIPKKLLSSANIDASAFVIGLVARGIKEKGFGEAAQAVKRLREKTNANVELILVGNGEFINQIKDKYAKEEYIHFIDDLKRPSEWIGWVKNFDLGILPTYFASETLPNSVIEYLAYEVPVVSTHIGDIPQMLNNNGVTAGIVVELKNSVVEVDDLEIALEKMYMDKIFYNECRQATKTVFSMFNMNNFAESYFKMM